MLLGVCLIRARLEEVDSVFSTVSVRGEKNLGGGRPGEIYRLRGDF